jgi:exonuclease SbcC
MRPRYLEIEGLQSFNDLQKIDFDMLGQTGFFGIFGPTGSGKSTILDAITLALYGSVQRAAWGTQGIINTNSEQVRVCFTFDLFKGNRRKTYRVERVYRRKKDSNTSVENRLSRLMEIGSDGQCLLLADRPTEVNTMVEDLIGLRLNDFTRSVVLPQNRFQEFLLLEKSRKREMLERIFYLEEYGKQLSDKVNSSLNAAKGKLLGIQGEMAGLGDGSTEALAEAKNRMQQALANLERADGELKKAEAVYNEAKAVWELVKELEAVKESETALLKDADAIDLKRGKLEASKRARELADVINKYRDTENVLQRIRLELQRVSSELPLLGSNIEKVQNEYNLMKQRSEQQRPMLIETRAKLQDALKIQDKVNGLSDRLEQLKNQYNLTRNSLREKDKAIEDCRLSVEKLGIEVERYRQIMDSIRVDAVHRKDVQHGVSLEQELKAALDERKSRLQRCSGIELRVKNLCDEVAAIDTNKEKAQQHLDRLKAVREQLIKGCPGERSQLQGAIDIVNGYKLIYRGLESKHAHMVTTASRLTEVNGAIEESRERLVKVNSELEQLKAEVDYMASRVEMLTGKLKQNTAYMLAMDLIDGSPCPVCGSLSHPSPALTGGQQQSSDIERELIEANDSLKAKEKQYRSTERRYIALIEQLRGLEEQNARLGHELDAVQKEYKESALGLPAGIRDMGIDDIGSMLDRMDSERRKALECLDQWENRLKQIEDDIRLQADRLTGYTIEQGNKAAELSVNRDNLIEARGLVDRIDIIIRDKQQRHRDFIDRLGIESASAEMARIDQCDRQLDDLRKKVDGLRNEMEKHRAKLEALNTERQALQNNMTGIETEAKGVKELKIAEENRIREISGDGDIAGALENVKQKLDSLARDEKELFDRLKAGEEKLKAAKDARLALENRQAIYAENLEKDGQRLFKGLSERGFKSVNQAEECMLTDKEQQALEQQIGEYDKRLNAVSTRKELVLGKLGDRTIATEEWEHICEVYSDKKKEKEDSASLYIIAKGDYNRIMVNHERWKKLDCDRRRYQKRVDMLEHLQKLLRGNSFIEYIAEERLRYIAKEATETLGVLTRFRYALELDPDQGFVVRDNSSGGVCRAVTSLSGGETFLASLSLALALSKQIQLKGQSPLEFFFLDEGFGTLDSDLLDTVIDALERLCTEDRVIGVISHVPELRNRIIRRLMVQPPSSDGKGSTLAVERA